MSKVQANTIGSVDGIYEIEVKDIQPIGVGQTWQDVITDRVLDVWYINDTDKPIMVAAGVNGDIGTTALTQYFYVSSDGGTTEIKVAQNEVTSIVPAVAFSSSIIVPAGCSYKMEAIATSSTVSIRFWAELRG